MGILVSFKHILPFFLYAGSILLIARSLVGKTEWLLMFVIVLMPLRNVVERFHAYPLGKDLIDIFFIVLLIGVLVMKVVNKDKIISKTPINPVIVLMVLYTFITILVGSDYLRDYTLFDPAQERVQMWKNFCMLPLLFILTLNTIHDKKWVWRTVVVMCLTMIVMDAYLIRQMSWYSHIASRSKINGTFVYLGPNEIAAFYSQYTILIMGLYFFMKRGIPKMLVLGLIIVNIFCILFLFSRGAYAAFIIGLFFLFSIKKRVLLVFLFLIIIYWQIVLPQEVRDRIMETRNVYGELDQSSELRLIVWQHCFDLFNESPITGVGYGVFKELGYELGDTHNIYLKILAEQGLFGIAIFLLLLFIFFIQGIKLFLGGDDDISKGLGLGFAMSIIVLMVNNIFGDRWTYMEVSAYLWVFAALVVRLLILSKDAPQGAKQPRKKNEKIQKS